jgi:hypothetical protein
VKNHPKIFSSKITQNLNHGKIAKNLGYFRKFEKKLPKSKQTPNERKFTQSGHPAQIRP